MHSQDTFISLKRFSYTQNQPKGRGEGDKQTQPFIWNNYGQVLKCTNTALNIWEGKKQVLCVNYPVAVATSNNSPIAILKTLCETQNSWVQDEKNMMLGRSDIHAVSPDLMWSFHDPNCISLSPKVEKYFKFVRSLPWDYIEPPDKSSYYEILAGSRWTGKMSEEEMAGMQIFRGCSLLRKMLPLASWSVTENCLNAFPPLKANIECQSLQSLKATEDLALEKNGLLS